MRTIRSLLLFSLFGFLAISATSGHAQEAPAFTTALKSTYAISTFTAPRVTHEVTITNETRESFIREFTLSVNSQTVADVTASSPSEPAIPVTITREQNNSLIVLTFSKPVLGLGKSSSFLLSYSDPSIYSETGLIKEVQIPPFEHGLPITSHAVTVEVPPSFDALSRSYPQPSQLSTMQSSTGYQYTFSGSGSSAIYLLFGQTQRYDLLLRYHLSNPTITPVYTQIVLAPDTAYQRVFYDSIQPQPDSVTKDIDGNWLASFTLEPKTSQSVIAKGFVEVSDTAHAKFDAEDVDVGTYTAMQPYWNTQSVKDLARELGTPAAIYDYVVETLDYDYARLAETVPQRFGSDKALANPSQALCFEFTDTFVALARAAGIPARAVMGFAQTSNQSLRPLSANQEALHAWPEYFDSDAKQWRSIDPTWQKTTGGVDYFNHFDFSHVALSVLGASSESPLPAGYYKQPGVPTKDVFIQVSQSVKKNARQLAIKPSYSLLYHLGMSRQLHLTITQTQGSALYDTPLTLKADTGETVSVVVPVVLPFSTQTVTIPAVSHSWEPTIATTITYDNYTQNFRLNNPKPRQAAFAILALTLGSAAAIAIAKGARRLLV
jgi:transglutaminase-like putative cysteine protease